MLNEKNGGGGDVDVLGAKISPDEKGLISGFVGQPSGGPESHSGPDHQSGVAFNVDTAGTPRDPISAGFCSPGTWRTIKFAPCEDNG
uniref:Uncharacterized protein n=1 Tax=Globodera pallida TaxID=36090 RepID=A0A183BLB2_GLOPA